MDNILIGEIAVVLELLVSPKTTNEQIHLIYESNTEQKVMLEVMNAVGKPVLLRPWKLLPGENILTLDHNEWKAGKETFIIRVVDKMDQVVTKRLLIF